jgi:hypothetical protein
LLAKRRARDVKEALGWLRRAQELGSEEAASRLDDLMAQFEEAHRAERGEPPLERRRKVDKNGVEWEELRRPDL